MKKKKKMKACEKEKKKMMKACEKKKKRKKRTNANDVKFQGCIVF